MAADTDPYRTLGLQRGASLDEVKRAYRRLAKANHPDAAGEAALPRFLAIQAAYDQIAGPDPGIRRGGTAGGGAGSGSSAGRRRPWEADADRAGATHRAYGGRTRNRPGPRPRPSGPPPGSRPGRPPRGDRPPNKATLGSTSYDGADAEPMDPDWGGASWYGTSSGTYWTLNPKEYADPRKHGPEYQARARRADQRRAGPRSTAPDTPSDEGEAVEAGEGPAAGAAASPGPGPRATRGPAHTGSSWWGSGAATTSAPPDAATGRASEAPGTPRSAPPPPPGAPPVRAATKGYDDSFSTETILDGIRHWLDDRHPGFGARIGRAVIGWAPIALGIGWFAGEVSGCGRFSADCHPAVAPVSWGVQLAVLVLLIAFTRIARVATVGTIATLAAIFPASALLLATFDPDSMSAGRTVLGGLMATAWIAGIAFGAAREFRRKPVDRPVS